MSKKREINEYSTDPAAREMLIRAEELGIGTAFTRADKMVACNIGSAGMCCKNCSMGPCRLTKNGDVGVCGATLDTIQARNLTRAIAAGAAAHSDHGRGMAMTLKATANGEAEGYMIRDIAKLRTTAALYDIPIEGRPPAALHASVVRACPIHEQRVDWCVVAQRDRLAHHTNRLWQGLARHR